jgi:hypothetical protein
MGKTLAQLISDARTASNTQRSKFVTDDEIGNYVNRGYRELYDLIIAADKSYYNATQDITFGTGTESAATMPLPPDFYQIRGLLQNPDTLQARPVYARPFTNHSLNELGYVFGTSTIMLGPEQLAAAPYRMTYVPKPAQFGPAIDIVTAPTADAVVASTGVWTFVNGHFTASMIGASLIVSGAANAGNNAAFVITAVSPTTVTTATTGLVNESFTGAASASIALQAIAPTYPTVSPYQAASMTSLDITADNFDDYISVFTAVRIVEKKKQSTDTLIAVLNGIAQRVQNMAPQRSGEPEAAPVLWGPSQYPYRGLFPGTPWD